MGYNVLYIEKFGDYLKDYSDKESDIRSCKKIVSLFTKHSKHTMKFIEDLDYLEPKEYSNSNCVVIHPTNNKSKLSLIKKLKEDNPKVGLIFITGEPTKSEDEISKKLFIDGGGNYILLKPFQYWELIKAVEIVTEKVVNNET